LIEERNQLQKKMGAMFWLATASPQPRAIVDTTAGLLGPPPQL